MKFLQNATQLAAYLPLRCDARREQLLGAAVGAPMRVHLPLDGGHNADADRCPLEEDAAQREPAAGRY